MILLANTKPTMQWIPGSIFLCARWPERETDDSLP